LFSFPPRSKKSPNKYILRKNNLKTQLQIHSSQPYTLKNANRLKTFNIKGKKVVLKNNYIYIYIPEMIYRTKNNENCAWREGSCFFGLSFQGEVEQLKLEPTTHKLEQNSQTKSEGQNKIQKKMSAKQQQNNKPTPCWNLTPSGPANSPTQNIQMIQINKTYC